MSGFSHWLLELQVLPIGHLTGELSFCHENWPSEAQGGKLCQGMEQEGHLCGRDPQVTVQLRLLEL